MYIGIAVVISMLYSGVAMQKNNFSPMVMVPGIVKGKPFEADVESLILHKLDAGQTKQSVMKGKIYRDSSGRRRQDMRFEVLPDQWADITSIIDPSTQTYYIIDNTNKTVVRQTMNATQEENNPGESESDTQENGLSRKIEGISCYEHRLNLGTSDVEFCFSPELREVLFEKRISNLEEKVIRLFNIHRIEPEVTLFAIPPNYKIISR